MGASIEYVVRTIDASSMVMDKIAAHADTLDKQLEDLGKRVADPEVNLEDSKFTLGMIRAAERLDKLSAQVADPSVEVDTARAQTEILRINAMLDRLDAKQVNVTVDVDRRGGIFSRLLGSGGEGGGGLRGLLAGGPSGLGTGLAGLGGAGPYALGGLAALIATLVPAALPAALGLGAGGIAAGGAFAIGKKENEELQKLNKAAMTATGKKKRLLEQQIRDVQKTGGPELGIFSAFQDVGMGLLGSFTGALSAPGRGFSGGPGGQAGAPSFATGLLAILKQVGSFVKTLTPMLGDLFRASLPYLGMFVKFLEQAARVLLPAFTKMLVEFQPFLPVFAKGLMDIVKGLVGFLNAIGPSGMKAAARIFVILTEGMAAALVALGHTINWLTENIPKWVRFITNTWKTLSHETAVIFDGVRHEIAHIWDMIFNNTVGRVIRGGHDIEREFNTWRHNTAVIFDNVRHDIAATWDTIWNNTVGRVKRGISDVISWFKGLPGRALDAINGLGTMLYNFGHMALTKLWNGLKSVFDDVWGWFKSLPSKLLNAIGIHSPPDWAIQAGKHIMGGILHGITSRKDELLSQMRAISTGAVSGMGVAPNGPVQQYARKLLAAYGWAGQWAAFNNVVMRESGWNPYAANPTSGAYGIPQALPGSKMASAGADWRTNPYTQLRWMMGYIASRYGSPAGAWAHELSAGWYDRGGWLPPGISLAANMTGRPERVLPPGGAQTVNIYVNVPPTVNPRQAGQQIADILLRHTQAGGRLYPVGVTPK